MKRLEDFKDEPYQYRGGYPKDFEQSVMAMLDYLAEEIEKLQEDKEAMKKMEELRKGQEKLQEKPFKDGADGWPGWSGSGKGEVKLTEDKVLVDREFLEEVNSGLIHFPNLRKLSDQAKKYLDN